MVTNELKKGDRVLLANGWYATIADNAKGNIRVADVEGFFRETGSVYSHDIVSAFICGVWVDIVHTPAQIKCRIMVNGMFG